jgi:hypothetical protein
MHFLMLSYAQWEFSGMGAQMQTFSCMTARKAASGCSERLLRMQQTRPSVTERRIEDNPVVRKCTPAGAYEGYSLWKTRKQKTLWLDYVYKKVSVSVDNYMMTCTRAF